MERRIAWRVGGCLIAGFEAVEEGMEGRDEPDDGGRGGRREVERDRRADLEEKKAKRKDEAYGQGQ